MDAYGAAVGFSKPWLNRILRSSTRLRLSTFTQFVESGVVRAEWLFCGTGPMTTEFNADEFGTLKIDAPHIVRSANTVFDTTTINPTVFDKLYRSAGQKISIPKNPQPAFGNIAQAIFAANTANKPVILYVSPALFKNGGNNLICEFIRKKWITAVVIPSALVEKDLRIKANVIGAVLRRAAFANIGAGEGLGNWAVYDKAARKNSILATAYDAGIPAFVQTTIGDCLTHMTPAIHGVNFGAVLGATAYVDALAFVELLNKAKFTGPPGVLLVVGSDFEPLLNSINVAWRCVNSTQNNKNNLVTACFTTPNFAATAALHWSNIFAYENINDLFAQLYAMCDLVYKGELSDVGKSSAGGINN
jgi:hypothetical protein